MASGALPLLEASKSGSDMKKAGVVELIIHENPIIEQLPWMPIAGNALQQRLEDTLPDVQFRQVNAGYTSSHGTDTQEFWGVAILGGEFTVDNFLVDVIGSEEDIEAKQWKKLAKSNAMRFGYEALNGDGTGNGFKGVKQLIDEGHGQESVFSATGAALTLAGLDAAFDLFINQGDPDAIWINRTLRSKVTNLARTTYTGISLIDVGTDTFGRKVTEYNGVPMRLLGNVRNGSGATVEALPFTEDPGDGGADTASIYLVKFGEDDVCGLLGKNGHMSVRSFGELQDSPARMGRMEWYPGLAIFNPYSIVRISGITNA